MKIFLTGSNGFIGNSIQKYFSRPYEFFKYKRDSRIIINEDAVLHFAGKAHDLKNTTLASEYYEVNTEFTKKVYDTFLESNAKVFIFLSSVKAVADKLEYILTEDIIPNPITPYGKSKLLAEQYILSKKIPSDKRVYILRPCMIHGEGNKGNLNLLFNFVKLGIPWPLGAYNNNRSYCYIENLIFIIKQLLEDKNIPTGIYNISDDLTISTNDLIKLISNAQGKPCRIWLIPNFIISFFSKFGDILNLKINSHNLAKLTETYVVSNDKIKNVIKQELPFTTTAGLNKTFFYLNSQKNL
jgi:nucleoside-diphosphate-sugar epimerase